MKHICFLKKIVDISNNKLYKFEIEGLEFLGVSEKNLIIKRGTYELSMKNFEHFYHFNIRDGYGNTIYFGGMGECVNSVCIGYSISLDENGYDAFYCLEAYRVLKERIKERFNEDDTLELIVK